MEKLGTFLGAIGVALAVIFLLAFPVQWLWNNCLVPAVNGINAIGFWQALGLMILANMLVKTTVETKSK
jgi:predicted membrane protein